MICGVHPKVGALIGPKISKDGTSLNVINIHIAPGINSNQDSGVLHSHGIETGEATIVIILIILCFGETLQMRISRATLAGTTRLTTFNHKTTTIRVMDPSLKIILPKR